MTWMSQKNKYKWQQLWKYDHPLVIRENEPKPWYLLPYYNIKWPFPEQQKY